MMENKLKMDPKRERRTRNKRSKKLCENQSISGLILVPPLNNIGSIFDLRELPQDYPFRTALTFKEGCLTKDGKQRVGEVQGGVRSGQEYERRPALAGRKRPQSGSKLPLRGQGMAGFNRGDFLCQRCLRFSASALRVRVLINTKMKRQCAKMEPKATKRVRT
jgi:hypothetical protein